MDGTRVQHGTTRDALGDEVSMTTALRFGCATLAVCATASAQAASVPELFEKHGLIGAWAIDCGTESSAQNPYVVYRALGADHVQRDTMASAATRTDASLIDRAAEAGPGRLSMTMTSQQRRMDLVVMIDGKRMRTVEITNEKGDKLVADGRLAGSGIELPWVNRCTP
jgi:hypothetical protein